MVDKYSYNQCKYLEIHVIMHVLIVEIFICTDYIISVTNLTDILVINLKLFRNCNSANLMKYFISQIF